MTDKYISVRRQLWNEPVFSPDEPIFAEEKGNDSAAPTRHQVDVWKAEASNFAATFDEFLYGRRDRYDLIATRAYQAGRASVLDPTTNTNP